MLLENKEKTIEFGQVKVELSISDPCGIVKQYESATQQGSEVGNRNSDVSA